MAKKEEKAKIVLERTYNVPLRESWLKSPRYRRAKKAMTALREFLSKNMKGKEVKIGPHLNLKVWEKGIQNPPHHVKVTAIKYDNGIVRSELVGFPVEIEGKKAEKKKIVKKETEDKPTEQEKPAKPAPKKAKASDAKTV